MAHQPQTVPATNANDQITRDQVDELAAAAATAAPAADPEPETPAPVVQAEPPTLAIGAQGDHVTDLTNILNLLGYATNSVITEGKSILDETVMSDVRAFKAAFGVIEPEIDEVKGELIGPVTWDALYSAAARELSKGI
jgi:hypothetical protein